MTINKKFLVINNNRVGNGISGGDQIFIQFIKYFNKKFTIYILACQETLNLIKLNSIYNLKIYLTDNKLAKSDLNFFEFIKHVIRRSLLGLRVLRKKELKESKLRYVFSSSDFYPDVILALYLKLINPRITWIAAFYMFAPPPFTKNNPYLKSINRFFTGVFYYLTQKFIYYFIRKKADFVILCNDLDKYQFTKDGFDKNKIQVIYGGVNLAQINKTRRTKTKLYDACFMARFHEQKGPTKFVEIASLYLRINSRARFAMIGDGPEMVRVQKLIKKKGLKKQISLFGFLKNKQRFKILKQAKVFIHSAIYETGGMAVAEAMACGLPVIAFYHPGFKYIYPKGILTTKKNEDINEIVSLLKELLSNQKKYLKYQKEGTALILKNWDWKKRFTSLEKKLF